MTNRTAYLACGHPGCANQLHVDSRHISNLTAGGGYDCGAHEHEEAPC